MVNRYRATVVGCGRMGAFTSPTVRRYAPSCWFPLAHAEAICAHNRLVLEGMADTDAAAVKNATKYYRVPLAFTDSFAMIDALHPDLLCVATRTIGRAQIIKHAIVSGVRALHVEKPLCNSVSELTELESLFSKADSFLTLGTVRRFMDPYLRAIEIARSGILGGLREVQINFGRGTLYWSHPHSVDLILQASGGTAVHSVSATLSNLEIDSGGLIVDSDPVVENAEILFVNGMYGRITTHGGCDMTLYCEQGRVAVESDGRVCYVATAHGDDPYFKRLELPDRACESGGTLAALRQLISCLDRDEAAMQANAQVRRDIFLGQRIIFSMIESAVSKKSITNVYASRREFVIRAFTNGQPA